MLQYLSIRDETKGMKYIVDKVSRMRKISVNKENQHFSIEQVILFLEGRKEVIDELKRDSPQIEINEIHDLIKHIIISLSGIDPFGRNYVDPSGDKTHAPDSWEKDQVFYWGEWRLEDNQSIKNSNGDPLGYSPNGELSKTIVPSGGGAAIHIYNTIPKKITWKLTHIIQKDTTFLIGKAKICEIEAVSSVPSLPEEMQSTDTALRILDKDIGKNEWQRRVNPKRIMQIADFINVQKNIIANSILLFSPPGAEGIKSGPDGVVTIDFSKFLKKTKEQYIDHWVRDTTQNELDADLRPMWLIDGQHRTRGLSQSELGNQMEIPIIMFTDMFSLNASAKIFAEINTLQKPLQPLHELFMQHRFNIPQNKGKRDFKEWDKYNPDTYDSRQNNLSYECAAWLASNEGGPLYNRIKFLEANQPNFTIIKANSWIDYSRHWFKSIPYPPDNEYKNSNEIFQEVENYFTAFVKTCNHGNWPVSKDENRWSFNSKNKGLLQMHSNSRALLDIYPTVWEKAAIKAGSISPITVEIFEEVLSPLYWVDWIDSDLVQAYNGSGETPRNAIRIWMNEAIIHGIKYDYEKVMSKSIKSKPGQGILSPPAESPIKNTNPDNIWPDNEKNGALFLSSIRPKHALPTSRWIITDFNGREWGPTGGYKVQQDSNGVAIHKFKWEPWVDEIPSVKIKVLWSNVNNPNAYYEIELSNPNFEN